MTRGHRERLRLGCVWEAREVLGALLGTAWGHQAPGLDAEHSPGLSWFLMDLGMVTVTSSLLPTALEDRKFQLISRGSY